MRDRRLTAVKRHCLDEKPGRTWNVVRLRVSAIDPTDAVGAHASVGSPLNGLGDIGRFARMRVRAVRCVADFAVLA
jgi:hypothetical protein